MRENIQRIGSPGAILRIPTSDGSTVRHQFVQKTIFPLAKSKKTMTPIVNCRIFLMLKKCVESQFVARIELSAERILSHVNTPGLRK